ncbi:BREX-2 system phosphatase PglZ [Micromonospora sp. NPDC047134]|uniref:BREX-2 system phosphatase PglZ n=1 Tax=Micromonospora sp. NPDC047134 TaxID=3154340 RepID=UPI0033D84D19
MSRTTGVTASQADSGPAALPVNPGALAQRIAQQFRKYPPREGISPVVLVAAAPVWPHDPLLNVGDRRVRVLPCVSVLAIWEQVTQTHDDPVVLLTDVSQHELGTGLLSRVFRRRVIHLEPWDLVAECFGARQLDSRLVNLRWAGTALIEAMPPKGWPRLPGTVLERDTALRHLASERLGMARLGMTPDALDVTALLWWTTLSGTAEALAALPEAERSGLTDWLVASFGAPMRALTALFTVDRLGDALPLGLVCAALWSPNASADPDMLRAQGRIEQYFGNPPLPSSVISRFGAAADRAMSDLLQAAARRDARLPSARQISHTVLDRAEQLLLMFGAQEAGTVSITLRSGFEHRLGVTASEMQAALSATDAGRQPERVSAAVNTLDAAITELAAHRLSTAYPHRVERARMALRLVRWLTVGTDEPTGIAHGVDQQVAEWGWVDLALEHVWAGDDAHTELGRAYRSVYDRVQHRRRELDSAFAERLANWTRDGSPTNGLLTVESLLPRIVAPVVQEGARPLLLIVLDGMSTAVAAGLGEELASLGWVEYDPLGEAGETRRRAAIAALPTVTSASRTSLLQAKLGTGDQAAERAAFRRHPLWRGRRAEIFHKGNVLGEAGDVLHERLVQALSDADTLVGVVVNTVDDALDHGRESADPGWQLANLGPLRALLDHARYHGRAVILTSDHGHVLERDTEQRAVAGAASARHRTDAAPAGEGEVELVGPRVVAEGQRVVALWDPQLRYLPRRAGYHGGVSLAEVTIPVLALLPLGASAPAGWQPLPAPQPAWWTTSTSTQQPTMSSSVTASGRSDISRNPVRKQRKPAAPVGATALFDLPGPPSAPSARGVSLLDQLFDSEMFKAQQATTPRRVPEAKIRSALAALLDNNGILPTLLLTERAGEQPARASGFVATLQRIFNVDNYPVLSQIDDGRNIRLDEALLRQQFGISERAHKTDRQD